MCWRSCVGSTCVSNVCLANVMLANIVVVIKVCVCVSADVMLANCVSCLFAHIVLTNGVPEMWC